MSTAASSKGTSVLQVERTRMIFFRGRPRRKIDEMLLASQARQDTSAMLSSSSVGERRMVRAEKHVHALPARNGCSGGETFCGG